MKTKQLITSAAIFTLFMLVFPNLSKAQAQCAGYTIVNSTTCTIKVNYGLVCGAVNCLGGVGVTINPNSFITLGGCDLCDCSGVKVILKMVDTTTMTVLVSSSATSAGYTSSTCSGTITWTGSSTTIN